MCISRRWASHTVRFAERWLNSASDRICSRRAIIVRTVRAMRILPLLSHDVCTNFFLIWGQRDHLCARPTLYTPREGANMCFRMVAAGPCFIWLCAMSIIVVRRTRTTRRRCIEANNHIPTRLRVLTLTHKKIRYIDREWCGASTTWWFLYYIQIDQRSDARKLWCVSSARWEYVYTQREPHTTNFTSMDSKTSLTKYVRSCIRAYVHLAAGDRTAALRDMRWLIIIRHVAHQPLGHGSRGKVLSLCVCALASQRFV